MLRDIGLHSNVDNVYMYCNPADLEVIKRSEKGFTKKPKVEKTKVLLYSVI